ncbi:MAG: ComEC family competence protein [Patescibacteria group bacterium]|nr:ComEC family competence protein [Patescibacteria group bacterium]
MLPKYKIFLIFCLAFILGIALASFLKISFFVCCVIFLFSLIFLIFVWPKKKIRIFSLALFFFLFGLLRYYLSWPKTTPDRIQFYNNEKVIFEGVVKKAEERIDKRELAVEAKRLIVDNQLKKIKGQVLIFVPLYSSYQYGDRLEVECQLNEPKPIEKFAYHEYLARYNIYSTCWPKTIKILERNQGNPIMAQIFKIKEKIKLAIDQNFTEPEGSIFSTLLLGLKKEVPQKMREVFSKTGIAHILAVSGLHVMTMTKILFIFCLSFFFLKRQNVFWLISLMLIFYVVLTGGAASAVRAGIMGFLLLLAEKAGRRKGGLNLIVFAAALMLLFNPKLLKNDLGFQLSYLGIFGIHYLSEVFYHVFKFLPDKIINIRQALATTFSAQIFVFPLVIYYWGNLSLGAPLANLLVLNILPYLMAFGFLFAFCVLIFHPLAKILFFLPWSIIFFLNKILTLFSQIPLFSINFGQIHFLIIIILYLAIFYFTWSIRKHYLTKYF